MAIPPRHWSAESAYIKILDDNDHHQRNLRMANSRLDSAQLETALQSDLSLCLEKSAAAPTGIPLDDLSPEVMYRMTLPPEKHKTYNYEAFDVSPMEAWQYMKDYNLRVHDLPTLDQMLRLPTPRPLIQSNFADFLRRLDAQHNLDFLSELEAYDKLWTAYQKSLNRASYAPSTHISEPTSPSTHFSAYRDASDTLDLLAPHEDESTREPIASRIPHGSLNREDLLNHARRIFRTFCSEDPARPIHLPDDHRQALYTLIETYQCPEPLVFEAARAHVFDCLDVFYYPRFLDAILYTNLSPASQTILFILGVIVLTAGFGLEFGLIFFARGGSTLRWSGLPVFVLGWSIFLASFVRFGWWLALLGLCETRFRVYLPIEHKMVKRIHRKRAMLYLVGSVACAILTTILFVFIPPTRLVALS